MTNSREELRRRVDELESTVRGLTQELVEANERIRQLEEEHEETPDTIVAGETDPDTTEDADPTEESDPAPETETDTGGEKREETDDIIVA